MIPDGKRIHREFFCNCVCGILVCGILYLWHGIYQPVLGIPCPDVRTLGLNNLSK